MWPFKQSVLQLKEKRDIPKLIIKLKDQDSKVNSEARKALIEVGDTDTIALLFAFYKNNPTSHSAQKDALNAIKEISSRSTPEQLSDLRNLNILDLLKSKSHFKDERAYDDHWYLILCIIRNFRDPKYADFLLKKIQEAPPQKPNYGDDYRSSELSALLKCGTLNSLAPLLAKNDFSIPAREEILNTIIGFGDPNTPIVLEEILRKPIIDHRAGTSPIDSVSQNMQSDHPDWYNSGDFIPYPDRAPDFVKKIKKYTK